jgi:3'-phosphoadenosine 5'-phosphosulfate synthase
MWRLFLSRIIETQRTRAAKQGAKPCTDPIPSDLLGANCIPQGFMAPSGWAIMVDYYQHKDEHAWIPYSTVVATSPPALAVASPPYSMADNGTYGSSTYEAQLMKLGEGGSKWPVSPWHDVPLKLPPTTSSPGEQLFNMVVEIPKGSLAKLEVQKELAHNPIRQDTKKGVPRFYTYGVPGFNYGLLPQTWEDPAVSVNGSQGDNDPLDAVELSGEHFPTGSVVPVLALGVLEMIDQGELDYKMLVLSAKSTLATKHAVKTIADLQKVHPQALPQLVRAHACLTWRYY